MELKKRARAYGLSRDDVKQLGLRDLSPSQSKRRVGQHRPGILIPYHDFSGHEMEFCRVRFSDRKEPKYGQPAGKAPRLYLPTIGPDWGDFVEEPEATAKRKRSAVMIVEGEWKSIAIAKLGIPCVGLGGVWNWQTKKQGREMIPDLVNLDVADRDVFIAFDSDVQRNPEVAKAREALSNALVNASARVYWVQVPDLDETSKSTGIDDYLHAQPQPLVSLGKLIDTAIPYAGLEALRSFNTRYVHLQGRSAFGVYEVSSGRLLSYSTFDRETVTSRVMRRSAKGQLAEDKVSHVWMEWEGRRRAKGFCFRPGEPGGLTADGLWNVAIAKPAPVKGDVTPFLKLVDHLFQHESRDSKRWFLGWCAHPFRRPHEKLLTSVYLWSSQQGAGKGQLARCLAAAHGAMNSATISFDDLRNDFVSARLAMKTFVSVDEASGGFETREFSGRIKKLITDPSLTVNQKYQPAFEVENVAAWLLTTNHLNSIKIEREGRRFFVVEGPRADLADPARNQLPTELVAELNEWLSGPDAAGALVHWFMRQAPAFENVAVAPRTTSFEGIVETMSSSLDEFARACVTNGVWEGAVVPELVSADDLTRFYMRKAQGSPISRQAMGLALTAAGARHLTSARGKKRVVEYADGRQAKPLVLRNFEHWAAASTREIVAYLTTNAVGASAPSTNPHDEVVRLRRLLREAEERAAKYAETQGKKEA